MPKPSVPLVAHGVPAPVKARAIQCAHEVLPLVPVRPITRIFRLGTPYHWRAMKPARSGKSDASKLGTVHAGAACSEDGCQITAAAGKPAPPNWGTLLQGAAFPKSVIRSTAAPPPAPASPI